MSSYKKDNHYNSDNSFNIGVHNIWKRGGGTYYCVWLIIFSVVAAAGVIVVVVCMKAYACVAV